jgi:hypothetical protein
MASVEHLAQVLDADAGVTRGGLEAGVTEQLLDVAHVGGAAQQVAQGRPGGEASTAAARACGRTIRCGALLAKVTARLVAGILGIGFDDLWRHERRRARRPQTLLSLVRVFQHRCELAFCIPLNAEIRGFGLGHAHRIWCRGSTYR